MRALSMLCTVTLVASAGCERVNLPPIETATEVHAVASTPAARSASAGRSVVLGTGWYANVEVSKDDRVHFAWTDADKGDVLYAVSPPGKLGPLRVQEVETDGAVGAHLHLKLTRAGEPVLIYFHQGRRMLRMAYHASIAGEDNTDRRAEDDLLLGGGDPTAGMGPGWLGEDVAFGDDAGRGAALVLDEEDAPHIIYYRPPDQLRYVRRPPHIPAFGDSARGIWEKIEVDSDAGGSFHMGPALRVRGGDVVAVYGNSNRHDSHLKVARMSKDTDPPSFEVSPFTELDDKSEGWYVGLSPSGYVWSTSARPSKLWRADLQTGASRDDILPFPGKVRFAFSGDDVFVISQTHGDGSALRAGIYLYKVPGGDALKTRGVLLERAPVRDGWLDVAVRSGGRPVAVWTSRATRSMRVYAP